MEPSLKKEPHTTLIAGVSPTMLELADKLVNQGERIVFLFRTKEKMQQLMAKASWSEESVLPLVASVTDGKTVIKAFEKVIKWTPQLDCLIYNVGIEPREATEAFSGAELVRVMGQNFYGFVNCFALALPVFKRAKRGHAVVICGIAALSLENQPAAYAASRAALQIYLRSLRPELTKDNVAVTELYLGRIPTAHGARQLESSEIIEGLSQIFHTRSAKHVIGMS